MKHRNIRVAIIGAGLGGLCLAQGLRKYGIDFAVYEKDVSPNSRTQGYRIRIDYVGQMALKECLSSDDYSLFKRTCSIASPKPQIMNPEMQGEPKLVRSWSQDDSESPFADQSANRLTMREVLLERVRDSIFFGKAFSRYEIQANKTIKVIFADGSSILTDVLVAADGANSIFMKQWMPELSSAESGAYCLYGKTAFDYDSILPKPHLKAGTSVIFGDKLSAVIDVMKFDRSTFRVKTSLTPVEDYIYFALVGQKASFGFNDQNTFALDGEKISAIIQHATRYWHSDLKDIFTMATPQSLAIMPVKTSNVLSSWQSSNITALGDAVHTMSPAGGVGANTALKDAHLLVLKLAFVKNGNADDICAAINEYETEMRQYSARAIQDSIDGAEKLYGGS